MHGPDHVAVTCIGAGDDGIPSQTRAGFHSLGSVFLEVARQFVAESPANALLDDNLSQTSVGIVFELDHSRAQNLIIADDLFPSLLPLFEADVMGDAGHTLRDIRLR